MSIALNNRIISEIRNLLKQLYGSDFQAALDGIQDLLKKYGVSETKGKPSFKNREVVLIAEADFFEGGKHKPLEMLLSFSQNRLSHLFTILHVLPFCETAYPNSTAVTNFTKAADKLGSFDLFENQTYDFSLMTDVEINHVSDKSEWLKSYLAGEDGFANFFVAKTADFDYAAICDDYCTPHFGSYRRAFNDKDIELLTTLGDGVVDLNYANYSTFLKMLDMILFYATKNVSAMRLLDAEYIWKTSTEAWDGKYKSHHLLRIIRLVVDIVKPTLMLSISNSWQCGSTADYLSSGQDEMQLVYNEELPGMLLYTMLKGTTRRISRWVSGLETGSTFTSILNASATYSDIDLRPLTSLLSKKALDLLADQTVANGGQVRYAVDAEGTRLPDKLNIGYLDAMRKEGDDEETLVKRFMAGQAIQLSLPGVPAIYLHSLLGTYNYATPMGENPPPNWMLSTHRGVDIDRVCHDLEKQDSMRAKVFEIYSKLLSVRGQQAAFHPRAGFEVAIIDTSVFAIKRFSMQQTIWAIINTSNGNRRVSLDGVGYFADLEDILSGQKFASSQIDVGPYEILWLESTNNIQHVA